MVEIRKSKDKTSRIIWVNGLLPLSHSPKFSNTDNIELYHKTGELWNIPNLLFNTLQLHHSVFWDMTCYKEPTTSPHMMWVRCTVYSFSGLPQDSCDTLVCLWQVQTQTFSLLPEHADEVRHRLPNPLYFDEQLTDIRTFTPETKETQRWTFPIKLTDQDFLFLQSNSNCKPHRV